MSKLETSVLNTSEDYCPSFYVRYVDDTLAIFKDRSKVEYFIDALKVNSCLNFTYEIPSSEYFNFLDLKFRVTNGKIETGIFVKKTDRGLYFDYCSYIPDCYKLSLIKTLVFRAYRLCSSWNTFHVEIERITKNLIQNRFPMNIIQTEIRKLIDKLYTSEDVFKDSNQLDDIRFFTRCFDASSFKGDKQYLEQLFRKHVIPNDEKQKISIMVYYKPKKLSSCFSLRTRRDLCSSHDVVYRFDCPKVSCQASYIGYTTNTLKHRAQQHKYKPSKIHDHFMDDHNETPTDLLDNFSILYGNSNFMALKLAEALLIRDKMPDINVRYNEMSAILNLYK